MDDADRAQIVTDHQVELQLAAVRRANAAAGVEADRPALRVCRDCDDPIEPARLAARPAAVLCVHCQGAAERRAQTYRRGASA